MIHEVKGCADCCFCLRNIDREDFCSHPKAPEDCIVEPNHTLDGIYAPFCPLKKEDITIKLSNNEK